MARSSAMDKHDESMKKQIASLLQVMSLVKSFKEDNTPCKIDEGLFLGSIGTATNKDALKSINITHILTVAVKLPPAHPGDFVYKIVEVIDKEDVNLKQFFDECFDFIDEAKRHGGGVLVHCFAGKSRSVTVIVAYLMKTRRMSLSEALQHVKSRRPLAAPNPGFMRQLEDFENSLQKKKKKKKKMVVGDVEKMMAVGLVWGATNAIMRRGALLWDEALKSSPKPHPNSTLPQRILLSLRNWLKLLSIWQYSIPFAVNLSASVTFFAILSHAPLSLAVPVTNATTFAATALFGILLGERTHLPLAFLGTAFIVLGLYLCINS